ELLNSQFRSLVLPFDNDEAQRLEKFIQLLRFELHKLSPDDEIFIDDRPRDASVRTEVIAVRALMNLYCFLVLRQQLDENLEVRIAVGAVGQDYDLIAKL